MFLESVGSKSSNFAFDFNIFQLPISHELSHCHSGGAEIGVEAEVEAEAEVGVESETLVEVLFIQICPRWGLNSGPRFTKLYYHILSSSRVFDWKSASQRLR